MRTITFTYKSEAREWFGAAKATFQLPHWSVVASRQERARVPKWLFEKGNFDVRQYSCSESVGDHLSGGQQ
jgi:hypothetical protein